MYSTLQTKKKEETNFLKRILEDFVSKQGSRKIEIKLESFKIISRTNDEET